MRDLISGVRTGLFVLSLALLLGGASGGLFRSDNGGIVWKPVFDDQPVLSMGDVAVSRANPDLVWVGTGEDNLRQSVSIGRGVFRSLDGGDTWTNVGLQGSERISKVVPHPTDPNVLYVGALGTLWSDSQEKGLYKTTDMGKTWQKLLFVNARTGAGEVVMDPRNPDKLFVAMYEARRTPWIINSGGPGSGLYLTRDGGATFKKLGPADGLPAGDLGRIAVAIAPSSPNVVYALIESDHPALLRSDDGGVSFHTVNDRPGVDPRPMYFSELRVDPKNENRLYRLGNTTDVSEDAGRSFRPVVTSGVIHGDVHALWVDPDDGRELIMGNDGGFGISYDRGVTWRFIENLPLAQFYQVSVDNAVPFNVYGGVHG